MARQKPRSDFFTFAVHWLLITALSVSLFTGLRIAADMPQSSFASNFSGLLPQGNVIFWHLISAVGFVALFAAYAVFIWRAGLWGRIALNRSWRTDIMGGTDARGWWRALNVLIYWVAFAALIVALITGLAMGVLPGLMAYPLAAMVHEYAAWVLPAYMVVHVAALAFMGGVSQLLKIFRPTPAFGIAAGGAVIAGTAAAAMMMTLERTASENLMVMRTDELPDLDGNPDDASWGIAAPVTVTTTRGANSDEGVTDVTVRALHDGTDIYVLLQWEDATRSQKHLPLVRTEAGWQVQQSEFSIQDEDDYYEDKFGVMLSRGGGIAGDHSIHLGPQPLDNAPEPSGGRGLHYTTDGSVVDVWHWKSVRTGNTVMNQIDDNYFGPPMVPKGEGRYTGGYSKDPKDGGGYAMNWEEYSDDLVTPVALPRDPSMLSQFQQVNLAPDAGDDIGLFLRESETVPYDPALDTLENFPVGTILPAVIVDAPMEGDRGDVTAVSHWENGVWTMEVRRKLDTGSEYDVAFLPDAPTYLWVAAFDHAQTRHTRHLYPVVVELE
ncbi:ethylbenzene dehydrogenase-related protein [uncultured Tateyamaria sp.]|uniref:ethylbenzene dehydrogenase-related protein n=1 Tax=uncultured Tateyamaria sp. TaxID=455651 RepID=UPI00261F4A0C|nr:ethylbenzene dehydrogenase-related protein [uncultured Tateyamaria sp.]